MDINGDDKIETILGSAKTIAVVGLSSNPSRASFGVSKYMQSAGYRIIPINPNEIEVLGEKAFANLRDAGERVDLVNVFRRAEEAGAHVDEAIAIGARAVWLQEGVIDSEAAARAARAGLDVVMDRCIAKEHQKRLGRS